MCTNQSLQTRTCEFHFCSATVNLGFVGHKLCFTCVMFIISVSSPVVHPHRCFHPCACLDLKWVDELDWQLSFVLCCFSSEFKPLSLLLCRVYIMRRSDSNNEQPSGENTKRQPPRCNSKSQNIREHLTAMISTSWKKPKAPSSSFNTGVIIQQHLLTGEKGF